MDNKLQVGLRYKAEIIVTEAVTAKSVGSGSIDVFATPAMIALMEQAAAECVQPYLKDDETTVGIKVDISHSAATPIDMEVYAKAELLEIDNKRLVFKVEAFDEKNKIGEGMHERFIINTERFMEKVNKKGQ